MAQFFKSYFTQSEFKRFNKKIETYIFIFKQQDFEQKDIPELIKDVWIYSDNHGKNVTFVQDIENGPLRH